MKKKLYLFIAFLISCSFSIAQTTKKDILYLCTYDYSYLKDSMNKTSIVSDVMNLEIFKTKTMYYSRLKQIGYAKTLDDIKKQTPVEVILNNEPLYYHHAESEIIEYSINKNQFTLYDQLTGAKSAYRSIDSLGTPSWKLHSDTMTILGQLCQKATTSFRGRNFVAWFARKIPFAVGPWKFEGLPGLVLKADDTRNQFHFQCTQLQKKPNPAPLFNLYSDCKTIKYKELLSKRKLKAENFHLFSESEWPGVTVTVSGELQKQTKTPPYNPIELK